MAGCGIWDKLKIGRSKNSVKQSQALSFLFIKQELFIPNIATCRPVTN